MLDPGLLEKHSELVENNLLILMKLQQDMLSAKYNQNEVLDYCTFNEIFKNSLENHKLLITAIFGNFY